MKSGYIDIEIAGFESAMKQEWNDFIRNSKNGTFLLDRNYMDYHSDRFVDMSLMIYRKGKLFGVLPGNRKDSVFYSHQGLTYGGLIMDAKMTVGECVEVFGKINSYLRVNGIKKVVYKPIPYIYHLLPAQEDLYALFVTTDAVITSRCISSTIDETDRIKFTESRKSGLRKAKKFGVEVKECDKFGAFWNILNENLQKNHSTAPVHSCKELVLLKSRFPDNIRLFVACKENGDILGGSLLYETKQVVHTQYISASEEGKECGALDLLFDHLINERYAGFKYFDFGHSTENGGRMLNQTLIFQKEGFGGRGVCYDIYEYAL